MFVALRLRPEGGAIEGVHHVGNVQAVLARHRLDSAVVATVAEMEVIEDGCGCRVALFHVTNDHVAADQLIESEHRRAD